MDEREKIAQLLCKQTGSNENRECETCPFNGCIAQRQADALIAAGIGDVSKHRLLISKDGTEIKQLYSGEEVEQIVKERDEYKHRAEVAERAFDNTMKVSHEILSAIFPNIKIGLYEWKKDILAIAEKELAEEG